MAVRVTPLRGMNTTNIRTFEKATRYEIKEAPGGLMLNVYESNKKVYTVYPGYWETVEVVELLDAPAFPGTNRTPKGRSDREKTSGVKKSPKKAVKKAGGGGGGKGSRITREGARIRTSPLRGDKL